MLVDAHHDGGVPFEGLGGRLRLRRLVVVGRGRGFFGGHVCSLVAGRVAPREGIQRGATAVTRYLTLP